MIVPVLKLMLVHGEPEQKDDFLFAVSVDIGVEGEVGVEYFYCRIMTPKRMLKLLEEDHLVYGRATFIVETFDLTLVESEINQMLKNCIRPTWDEATKAINRYLDWEYDDSQYKKLK